MPEQYPISSSISRSNSVRVLIRSASRSLPSSVNCLYRMSSSSRMSWRALRRRSCGMTKYFAGYTVQELQLLHRVARQGVEPADPLDLIAEKLDAHGHLRVRGPDLQHVAAGAEPGPLEHGIVALVLQAHEAPHELAHVGRVALLQLDAHLAVVLGIAQPVDARHGGHDDHVPPFHEGGRRREPHPLDLPVDRRVLLYVQVLARHVGLGLVVVVVRDEVLHGVVRKEVHELAVQLRGEGLVVGEHEGGKLDLLDDLGHGEGLAGSR